jgi:diadenosine tetraphosphate (Ap4A) HIT family hydrolase
MSCLFCRIVAGEIPAKRVYEDENDFTEIEAWARVTSNAGGDSYPDVWIDRERSIHPQLASGRVGPAGTADAKPVARLVAEARLVTAGLVPAPESIAPYRHALVVSTYEIVTVLEGDQPAVRSTWRSGLSGTRAS